MKLTGILAAAPTMDLSGIQTAMTSAFKQVQAGASDMITAAVPFALVTLELFWLLRSELKSLRS